MAAEPDTFDKARSLLALADQFGTVARVPALSRDADEDSAAAVANIEAALRQVPDDHPARGQIMVTFGFALLHGMLSDRSATSLDTVLELLRAAVARKAADPANDAVNRFLLGLVTGLQGMMNHDVNVVDDAIRQISEAMEVAPPGHQLHSVGTGGLVVMLYLRYLVGSELEYLEAALHLGDREAEAEPPPADEAGEVAAGIRHFMRGLSRLARARHRLDAATLDETMADLQRAGELFPEHHVLSSHVDSTLGMTRVLRSSATEDGVDFATARANLSRFREGVEEIAKGVSEKRKHGLDYPTSAAAAGMAYLGEAFVARDTRKFAQGLGLLSDAATAPGLGSQERVLILSALGVGFRMRFEFLRRRQDLDNAIDRLDEARRVAWHEAADSDAAPLLNVLADCLHTRGDEALRDRERAVTAGLDSLRERARHVRLQTGTRRALNTAAAVAGEAVSVTRWCLAAGRPEAAVCALEIGRGMVLHASTSEASIPTLLRERGEEDLAHEWEAAADDDREPWDTTGVDRFLTMLAPDPTTRVRAGLRRRVLRAIDGHGADADPTAPPAIADIVSALDSGDVSALVYLLPADADGPGTALIVRRDGQVRESQLPGLRVDRSGPLDEFDMARDDAHRRAVLARLCEWAWPVAMESIIGVVTDAEKRRLPKVILVPVGRLAVVPWHAAHRVVADGAMRYACQDAVISYAASARQFVEASRGDRRPWDSAPGIVRVGESKLYWASREIEQIRRRYYANATCFGGGNRRATRPSPPATPDNVRALLPGRGSAGVSLLHLAAHAFLAAPPIDSFLALSGHATGRLHVRDILEQARHRPPDAVGGLVVLAACVSDHSGHEHDEALTLAAAFLAAGAIGVVGAKWEVADLPTAIFMIMFHHYLNSGYDDPATALRAAQLWMLNPDRRLPAGVDQRWAPELSRLDLTAVDGWAAFTYQGR